jgi:hypothetical protein
MANQKIELSWTDLLKMGDEVKAEDGPGSKHWDPNGSETQRVNELFMRALRENQGKVPGELEAIPGLIITTIGAKTGLSDHRWSPGNRRIHGRCQSQSALVPQSGQKSRSPGRDERRDLQDHRCCHAGRRPHLFVQQGRSGPACLQGIRNAHLAGDPRSRTKARQLTRLRHLMRRCG